MTEKTLNSPLYTSKEVMEVLRIRKNTLHTLIKTKKLTSVQFVKGGKRLFPKADVDAFIKNKTN